MGLTAIEYLDQEAKKISAQVTGVSIGRWNDKSTWRVMGEVTKQEAEAVQVLFTSFDKVTFESSKVVEKTLEERIADLEVKQTDLESQVSLARTF